MWLVGVCRCAWQDRRGVTAVEYAIMGGLIAVAVSLGTLSLTGGMDRAFHTVARAFPS